MKKFYLLGIVLMAFILCGCGNKEVDLNKTSTITFHDLKADLPTVFEQDPENSSDDIIFFSYTDEKNYNGCMLHFSFSEYPTENIKDAITEGLLGKTDYEYSEKEINGYKWAIGHREENDKFNQTYYAIVKDGKEYNFSYDDFGSGEDCAKALSIIEKSLKF